MNYADTFCVEDTIWKVCYDKYENSDGRFGYLFYKDKFSHYVPLVEYRFARGQTPAGAVRKELNPDFDPRARKTKARQ